MHGDFHEGQLFAEDGLVTAVIDIDTAGPGERSDEWATMLAHLSGLSLDRTLGQTITLIECSRPDLVVVEVENLFRPYFSFQLAMLSGGASFCKP